MQITIDTDNLSELDIAMLSFLAEQGEVAETTEAEEAPAPAKKTTKKAPAKEPEQEPEEEDLVGGTDEPADEDAPTLSDAVAAATELVSNGEAAKVKEALSEVGAKRVSEMSEEDVPAFLAALKK